MARDNVSRDDAKALLNAQMDDRYKIERSDFIVKNNGSTDQMIKAVDRIRNKIYQRYAKRIESA